MRLYLSTSPAHGRSLGTAANPLRTVGIIAIAGASYDAPENTVAACAWVTFTKADAWELIFI